MKKILKKYYAGFVSCSGHSLELTRRVHMKPKLLVSNEALQKACSKIYRDNVMPTIYHVPRKLDFQFNDRPRICSHICQLDNLLLGTSTAVIHPWHFPNADASRMFLECALVRRFEFVVTIGDLWFSGSEIHEFGQVPRSKIQFDHQASKINIFI